MRAVAAPRAVQTEAAVNIADAQDLAITCATTSFEIWDSLTRVFSDLSPAFEMSRGEAAFAVDRRLADCEAVREFHRLALYDKSLCGFSDLSFLRLCRLMCGRSLTFRAKG